MYHLYSITATAIYGEEQYDFDQGPPFQTWFNHDEGISK